MIVLEEAIGDDQDLRPGALEQVEGLVTGVAGADRDERRADVLRGEERLDPVMSVGGPHRDAVARLDALRHERPGREADPFEQLGVGGPVAASVRYSLVPSESLSGAPQRSRGRPGLGG